MVEKKSPVEDLGMGQVTGRERGKARQGSPVRTRGSLFSPASSQSGDILARCPWMMEEKAGGRRRGDGRESVLHLVLDRVDFIVEKETLVINKEARDAPKF